MLPNNLEESPVVSWILERPAEQCLGEALNRGERCLEFVRNVRNEILAHPLEPPEFGYVVQYDHGPGWFGGAGRAFRRLLAKGIHIEGIYRRRRHREAALLNETHRHFDLRSFASAQHFADQPQQVRVANDFDDRAPLAFLRPDIQDLSECAIAKDEPLLRIDDRHALDHAAQNRTRTVSFPAQ